MIPDKLFRDRLETLRSVPSASAWSRISVGIQQRQKQRRQWRLVLLLSMVLIAALGWLVVDKKGNTHSAPKNTIDEITAPLMSQAQKPAVQDDKTQPSLGGVETTRLTVKQKPVTVAGQHIARVAHTTDLTNIDENEIGDPIATGSVETPIETAVPVAETIQVIDGNAITQGRRITYAAAEVNARFRRKQPAAPIDTSGKLPSTLQRVLDVAYEIKHDNTWLGDFRQMKDELLTRPGNGPAREKTN